jgi:hypothetical protein
MLIRWFRIRIRNTDIQNIILKLHMFLFEVYVLKTCLLYDNFVLGNISLPHPGQYLR